MELRRLNRELRKIDDRLYAKLNLGRVCIFRTKKVYHKYSLDDGSELFILKDVPLYIFALTEDWTMGTNSVDWGLDKILEKLWKIDSYNKESDVSKLEAKTKEQDAKSKKDFYNKTKDIVEEALPAFKKAFNDFNTSTLNTKLGDQENGFN